MGPDIPWWLILLIVIGVAVLVYLIGLVWAKRQLDRIRLGTAVSSSICSHRQAQSSLPTAV